MVGVLGWRLLVERRWWLGLGAVAGLVLVVLSASRAAQAALLVACVVAVVLRLRPGAPEPAENLEQLRVLRGR